MAQYVFEAPNYFNLEAYQGMWWHWNDVERCFWPGSGGRSHNINPDLAHVIDLGGVYIFAWSIRVPGRVHPANARVKYIGETSCFKRRMGQFGTSAGFWGLRDNGHSAGWRWPEKRNENMWVSFFIVQSSDKDHLLKGLRCWLEALALEEHLLNNRERLPQVNEATEVVTFD